MRKKYLRLTKEQKSRGVIFSSQLKDSTGESYRCTIHEVFDTDEDKVERINNLKDSKFFNNSQWDIHEIRK